jgi:hypothetical protein
MKKQASKFVISSLAVLSLFVSTAWACACSHHEQKSEPAVVSCPHHEGMQIAVATVDNGLHSLSPDVDCICAKSASRFVAKSDAIKLKKQIAAIALRPAVVADGVRQTVGSPAVHFTKPFYLSDSFHNLAPKRGPPIL